MCVCVCVCVCVCLSICPTLVRGPSTGKPGDDRLDSVCDVFMGSRTTTTTQVSSEQRMEPGGEEKIDLYSESATGPKIFPWHKLRNDYRAATANLADLQGCHVAKFLSSPKRCRAYPWA